MNSGAEALNPFVFQDPSSITERANFLCAIGSVSMFASKAKEWRKHPAISPWNNFKACFTGFGTALALFTGYVVLEQAYLYFYKPTLKGEVSEEKTEELGS